MLLLDTNIVIWLAREPEHISSRAKQEMATARTSGEGLSVAGITLYEIALLASRGKLDFYTPLDILLEKIEATFNVLPMNWRIASRSVAFSESYPKDPADRQIGATALVHGLTLVTSDRAIRKSGEVPCIW